MTGLEEYARGGNGLAGVCIGGDGAVYACSTLSGEILRAFDGAMEVVASGRVGPSGLGWVGGRLIGADHGSGIFSVGTTEDDPHGMEDIVTAYRGVGLKGPVGVTTSKDGVLYFTDGGPLGTTSLANPRGSLYAFRSDLGSTTVIAAECLAQPTGLCLNPQGTVLYVCETAANRVLRYAERPKGVWHGSVFVQFAGMMGPTCIDCDAQGNVYIGRYDFKELSSESLVSVLRPNGTDLASFTVPGAEISGLALNKTTMELYITEASGNTMFKYQLPESLE
eukprot:TRINITY_DN6141_c0_g1_i1.p1 TRINITY_DN6141_c0_g1~~TRINITY_DN6141_c0_g1_i1.p1  ORF type:complete len:279 (+),score=18.90 TRINITY_DN6141_c0_g1_i1:79-915(+)